MNETELVVSQEEMRVYVYRCEDDPSLITLLLSAPGIPAGEGIDMTRRQAHHLANALLKAADLPGIAETPPETT